MTAFVWQTANRTLEHMYHYCHRDPFCSCSLVWNILGLWMWTESDELLEVLMYFKRSIRKTIFSYNFCFKSFKMITNGHCLLPKRWEIMLLFHLCVSISKIFQNPMARFIWSFHEIITICTSTTDMFRVNPNPKRQSQFLMKLSECHFGMQDIVWESSSNNILRANASCESLHEIVPSITYKVTEERPFSSYKSLTRTAITLSLLNIKLF